MMATILGWALFAMGITAGAALIFFSIAIIVYTFKDKHEPKRGRWVEHNYDPEYLICGFSCSECGYSLDEYYCGEGCWPGKTDHYFCPNCGARMDS